MNFGGTKTSRSLMVSQLVNKTMNLILDVWTCILAGWPELDLQRIYMDLHWFGGDFSDSGAWVPGALWQPVAGCGGKLWPPYTTMLGPWGLQAGRMVSGRLAGWLDGWMEG